MCLGSKMLEEGRRINKLLEEYTVKKRLKDCKREKFEEKVR